MERTPSLTQAVTGPPGELTSRDPALVAMDFQVGQRVSATVLEVLGEGKVLLGLRGIKVEAKTRLPLQEGKTYSFTVKGTGEKILLAPASRGERLSPSSSGILARLLAKGGGTAFRAGFQALVRLAREGKLPPPLAKAAEKISALPKTPAGMKEWVRRLGIGHEARLVAALREGRTPPADLKEDLKALLLENAPPARGGGQEGSEIGRVIRAALEGLESLQAENLHRARLGGGAMIPLPLVPGLEAGEIHLFPPRVEEREEGGEEGRKDREREERPFRVVFLLNLHHLGGLRVDAEVLGRTARILFRADSENTVRVLKENLPRLGSALAAAGLDPLSLEAGLLEREESLALPLPAGPGLERGRYVDVEG